MIPPLPMTAPMKALTIHQPWNWLIANRHKPVENRGWWPPKGTLSTRIALHAGKTLDHHAVDMLREEGYPLPDGYVLGAVEAVATVAGWVDDARRGARAPGTDMAVIEAARDHSLYCGPVGWVLTDVILLPEPVPCRGFQKLWTLPADVERAVLEQIARAA